MMTAQRLLRERLDDVVAEDAPRIATATATGRSGPRVDPPAANAGAKATNRTRFLTPAGIYFVAVLAAIAFGVNLPTSTYLSPQSGLGYALGIAGAA